MRAQILGILSMLSGAAKLCLSLMHPRLPSIFSMESAYALCTVAFVAPPSQMFEAVTLIPLGRGCLPGVVAVSPEESNTRRQAAEA